MNKISEKSQGDVEAQLESLRVDARNALKDLREVIRAVVANAEVLVTVSGIQPAW